MLRQATLSDVPAIKAIMKSEPNFWQQEWRDDALERGLATSGGLAFVWEEADQLLGFVCAHDLGFRGYLSELIVASSGRSRGIGRQLVQKVERELAGRGCAVLIADVWPDAEGFYRSLGWSEPEAVLLRKRVGETASAWTG